MGYSFAMKAVSPIAVRDLLILSLVAGGSDAVGFMGLGRVFTSNMTGNVVLLGIYLGKGDLMTAARALYVLLAFAIGVAIGVWLARDADNSDWPTLVRRVILPERAALVLFAIGWVAWANHASDAIAYPLLAVLAVAMGLQSSALSRLNAPGVGTTAITGTITALVTGLSALAKTAEPAEKGAVSSRIGFQAGVLALYCLGAAISGLLILRLPWLAGVWPAVAALFVTWGLVRKPSAK
jgi:uncharacterized membrane protein YoaK (UPF0700 family)